MSGASAGWNSLVVGRSLRPWVGEWVRSCCGGMRPHVEGWGRLVRRGGLGWASGLELGMVVGRRFVVGRLVAVEGRVVGMGRGGMGRAGWMARRSRFADGSGLRLSCLCGLGWLLVVVVWLVGAGMRRRLVGRMTCWTRRICRIDGWCMFGL